MFDTDPAMNKAQSDINKDEAIIKAFATETGNLVAYTIPKKRKRNNDVEEEEKPDGKSISVHTFDLNKFEVNCEFTI